MSFLHHDEHRPDAAVSRSAGGACSFPGCSQASQASSPGQLQLRGHGAPAAGDSDASDCLPGDGCARKTVPPSAKTGVRRAEPRQIAWKSLMRWEQGGVFAETLVAQQAGRAGLSRSDRALLQAMVYETLRNLSWLRYVCDSLRQGSLEGEIRWLIVLGLCQLLILHHAEHAAVSETVSLAPKRARGLVNAVLRNAIRRRESLEIQRASLPLHVRFSTPEWLVRRWVAEFGAEETEAMLAWNVRTPPVYARLNPLHPMEVPAAWEPLPQLPLWYRIHGPLPAAELEAGQLYIADPSTRYSIGLLAPQPGEFLLDACAAPGGKAVAMIGETGGNLHLLATDLHGHRLPQLRDNLLRAGGLDVQVARHDWSQPCPSEWRSRFDAVLLDVPCSNTGVLQRRVDARWRLCEGEIERLAALQLRILTCAAEAVRPGGRLVYSTCSVDRAEDRDVVDAFLKVNSQFELVRDYLALPHREKADGAYAALLRRLTR